MAAAAALLSAGPATASATTTVTVAPTTPVGENCYPFGLGSGGAPGWNPYAGFVYKNLPPFQLKPGDVLAFDLSLVNTEADIQLQIDMAPTTVNGGDVPSAGFTTIVPNTQTPVNPRGDTTTGNFELQFTSVAPFNFRGGGLIVLFSNASASYATDMNCTGNLQNAGASNDPSGYFVERFFNDADGAAPWANVDTMGAIGAFRLSLADVPPVQPVKKKCKRKHKHRSASAAKKRCKKKHRR